ncbi:MAG: exonuclease SbcCD subunit D, partial [Bacteroidales bacterium]|nr:exonuclease SbcCD subunit D [Bacteroidales bacterium]
LHTSDWHLGNIIYGYERLEDESNFLLQLKQAVIEQQPDCMIVSGDVFNICSPSAAVRKLYTDSMLTIQQAAPHMTTVVTAGNHDSPSKLEIDSSLWKHFNLHAVGSIAKTQDGIDTAKHIIAVKDKNAKTIGYVAAAPHFYKRNYPQFFEALNESIKQINTENLPSVLSAHLAVTGSEVKSNSIHVQDMEFEDISLLGDAYDYIALGHIHFPQTLQGCNKKIRYSGSPIEVSFNEQYKHGITVADISKDLPPQITTIEIHDNHPLVTLPDKPDSVENVFLYIEQHPELIKDKYVRLSVEVDNYLPPMSKDRANELCNALHGRFCTFDIHRNGNNTASQENKTATCEEFKKLSPVEVATNYLLQRNAETDPEFASMIKFASEYSPDQEQ